MKNCRIDAKLGKMRKEVDWVVYPYAMGATEEEKNIISIQADHYFCIFDARDGLGMLSKRIANYPGAIHCDPRAGGTSITVPEETVQAALDALPKSGDEVAPGLLIG